MVGVPKYDEMDVVAEASMMNAYEMRVLEKGEKDHE